MESGTRLTRRDFLIYSTAAAATGALTSALATSVGLLETNSQKFAEFELGHSLNSEHVSQAFQTMVIIKNFTSTDQIKISQGYLVEKSGLWKLNPIEHALRDAVQIQCYLIAQDKSWTASGQEVIIPQTVNETGEYEKIVSLPVSPEISQFLTSTPDAVASYVEPGSSFPLNSGQLLAVPWLDNHAWGTFRLQSYDNQILVIEQLDTPKSIPNSLLCPGMSGGPIIPIIATDNNQLLPYTLQSKIVSLGVLSQLIRTTTESSHNCGISGIAIRA